MTLRRAGGQKIAQVGFLLTREIMLVTGEEVVVAAFEGAYIAAKHGVATANRSGELTFRNHGAEGALPGSRG